MRLGIDLGTTRTVVARVDRGNYPVLTFLDADGDPHEHIPSVVALREGAVVYGFEAVAAEREGASTLRSFKRILGDPSTTPHSVVEVGDLTLPLTEVLVGFLRALRHEIEQVIDPDVDSPELEAVVSVPAHAHTTQRFLTLEAFRQAGFTVLALVNEPSAAGFEFTHRQTRAFSSRRSQVLVYDLGGGTFDASLVEAEGNRHDVIGSVGVNRLGGDDFDAVLAGVVLETAGPELASQVTRVQRRRLLEDCREAKESLTPQTRRLVLEVAGTDVVVSVDDFYAQATPLVLASVEAMEPLVGRFDDDEPDSPLTSVAGVYLVGGASGLPLVARVLRERFGRRVHQSPYPAAATAIGLAIAADPVSPFTLRERLSRGFGVFREGEDGATLTFDEIFAADVELPQAGSHTVSRRYRPAHNIGLFRYVEYSAIGGDGEPLGELVPVIETRFPYTPSLQHLSRQELALLPIARSGAQETSVVEESYKITPDGQISLTITDLDTGFQVTTAR